VKTNTLPKIILAIIITFGLFGLILSLFLPHINADEIGISKLSICYDRNPNNNFTIPIITLDDIKIKKMYVCGLITYKESVTIPLIIYLSTSDETGLNKIYKYPIDSPPGYFYEELDKPGLLVGTSIIEVYSGNKKLSTYEFQVVEK
jgi:hypothetical protein